mgnify:CR=1 FL=1
MAPFTTFKLYCSLNNLQGCIKNNYNGKIIMHIVYPLKLLNHLRPLLIGFRKANGLTQKDVSKRLGVTQQTYARLESNPARASFERLYKVFNALGVEINLSSGTTSSTIKSPRVNNKLADSPARREKW